MPELLTLELLELLDRALRDVGAAIVDHREPGLTREQMDALIEPHGFRMSEEAALWWGWHGSPRARPHPRTGAAALIVDTRIRRPAPHRRVRGNRSSGRTMPPMSEKLAPEVIEFLQGRNMAHVGR